MKIINKIIIALLLVFTSSVAMAEVDSSSVAKTKVKWSAGGMLGVEGGYGVSGDVGSKKHRFTVDYFTHSPFRGVTRVVEETYDFDTDSFGPATEIARKGYDISRASTSIGYRYYVLDALYLGIARGELKGSGQVPTLASFESRGLTVSIPFTSVHLGYIHRFKNGLSIGARYWHNNVDELTFCYSGFSCDTVNVKDLNDDTKGIESANNLAFTIGYSVN